MFTLFGSSRLPSMLEVSGEDGDEGPRCELELMPGTRRAVDDDLGLVGIIKQLADPPVSSLRDAPAFVAREQAESLTSVTSSRGRCF
jgi:hypothetical protein